MAQPNLEKFRLRALMVKAEVTEGTDSVPVAATDGILLMNGQSGTEGDVVEREVDRAFFGSFPFAFGNKRAFVEGDVEFFAPSNPGVGSTANEILLRMAGMTKVLTAGNATTTGKTRYNPISSAIVSASVYWGQTDKRKIILGARANFSRLSMSIGNRFVGTCRIMGTYSTVTDTALPTPTLYTSAPPVIRFDNSTCTVTNVTDAGSPVSLWAKELAIDFGNDLVSKEYTTKKVNEVNDRRPTFTLRIARTALADFNPWAIRDAGKIISAQMQIDELTGLYSQLGFRGQIEQINEVDIDGDYGWELTGRCIPSNAGNDEFWIEFGDTTAAGTP